MPALVFAAPSFFLVCDDSHRILRAFKCCHRILCALLGKRSRFEKFEPSTEGLRFLGWALRKEYQTRLADKDQQAQFKYLELLPKLMTTEKVSLRVFPSLPMDYHLLDRGGLTKPVPLLHIFAEVSGWS